MNNRTKNLCCVGMYAVFLTYLGIIAYKTRIDEKMMISSMRNNIRKIM